MLNVGDMVETAQAIDLEPYATIPRGETGRVITTEEVFGQESVTVLFDRLHPGLKDWDNTALLVRPELAYLVPVKSQWLQALTYASGGSLATFGIMKAHALQTLFGAVVGMLTALGAG